jgi:hypothetical protein
MGKAQNLVPNPGFLEIISQAEKEPPDHRPAKKPFGNRTSMAKYREYPQTVTKITQLAPLRQPFEKIFVLGRLPTGICTPRRRKIHSADSPGR